MGGLGLGLRRPYSVYSFTRKTCCRHMNKARLLSVPFCLLQSLPVALDSSLKCFID